MPRPVARLRGPEAPARRAAPRAASTWAVGQVGDVDVVAHAGAVAGRVVGAVERKRGAQARRRLERDGDQVGLGLVTLAEVALGIGAAGVEVAQRRPAQAVGRLRVGEHALDHRLGGAVGVDRREGRRLRDRLRSRDGRRPPPVEESTKARVPAASAASSSTWRARHVVRVVEQRVRHGLGYRQQRGEVEHAVEGAVLGEDARDGASRRGRRRARAAPRAPAARARRADRRTPPPCAPRAASARSAWLPMYPAPPVTSRWAIASKLSRARPVRAVVLCRPDGDRPHGAVRFPDRIAARGLDASAASPTSSSRSPAGRGLRGWLRRCVPGARCVDGFAPNRAGDRPDPRVPRRQAAWPSICPLDLRGTPFQTAVWQALLEIPYGETRSYAEIARRVGRPERGARGGRRQRRQSRRAGRPLPPRDRERRPAGRLRRRAPPQGEAARDGALPPVPGPALVTSLACGSLRAALAGPRAGTA